jgi:hypothetical protein
MFHGPRLFALFMIALIAACATGLGIACARDNWRNRRHERSLGGRS